MKWSTDADFVSTKAAGGTSTKHLKQVRVQMESSLSSFLTIEYKAFPVLVFEHRKTVSFFGPRIGHDPNSL